MVPGLQPHPSAWRLLLEGPLCLVRPPVHSFVKRLFISHCVLGAVLSDGLQRTKIQELRVYAKMKEMADYWTLW